MSIGVSKIVPFNFPYFTHLIIYIKRSKIGVRGKELKKRQQVLQPVAAFAFSCFREMTCFSQARRKVRKTVERCFLRRRKRWRKGSFFRGKRSVFGKKPKAYRFCRSYFDSERVGSVRSSASGPAFSSGRSVWFCF